MVSWDKNVCPQSNYVLVNAFVAVKVTQSNYVLVNTFVAVKVTQSNYVLVNTFVAVKVTQSNYVLVNTFVAVKVYAGPRNWKDLPPTLRTKQTLNSFKEQLKSHLFKKHC